MKLCISLFLIQNHDKWIYESQHYNVKYDFKKNIFTNWDFLNI